MAINLSKGSSIDLSKDGKVLTEVSFGVNWGMIVKKTGFFGLGSEKESVDLDASCATFDKNNKLMETIYYGNKSSNNRSIRHSGDDLSGDSSKDDKDNEVISVNLQNLSEDVKTVVFFLNSYRGHSFEQIPYSEIRVLDERMTPMAKYNLTEEHKFGGTTSMILGKIVKTGSNWKFTAIGEPSKTRDINSTINEIKSKVL